MNTFYAIILTLVYFLFAHSGRKDIFSPRFIFNAFAWLKNVPYFIEIGDTYPNIICERYFVYKLIGCICVNIGISIYEHNKRGTYSYTENVRDINSYKKYGILFCIVGLLIKLYIFQSSGGIFYILAHIQSRKSIMAGNYYYEMIANSMLTLSVMFTELYMIYNDNKRGKLPFAVCLTITIICLVVFGARHPALTLLLQVLMLYHFAKSKFTIGSFFRPKALAVIGAVMMFMVMMPMLRNEAENNLVSNPVEWAKDAANNIMSITHEFSYLSGDMFVFDYFHDNEKWWGASYVNILLQWIPRSVFPNKPPMDDGMYLLNMMWGEKVTPNMPTSQLYYDTSVPFTMEGALYSNFGLLGIILGCMLIGLLYQHTYRILVETNYSIIMILIYQEVMFVFVPSVLHATSTLIVAGVYFIILYTLFRVKIKKLN